MKLDRIELYKHKKEIELCYVRLFDSSYNVMRPSLLGIERAILFSGPKSPTLWKEYVKRLRMATVFVQRKYMHRT